MVNKWKEEVKLLGKIKKSILDYHSFLKKTYSFTTTDSVQDIVLQITKDYFEHIRIMEEWAKL